MDWFRGEKLGHGSFATVNLAVPRTRNPQFPPLMAVKSCGVLHSSTLMKEKSILDELNDCPEIIKCYGESFSFENGEKLYNVLLEYASGGDLGAKIKNSGDGKLPESDIRRYTKSLLKGIQYIHKIGYIHGDIKLQNILLNEKGEVKIADFGLAKRAGSKEKFPGPELVGTPLYMSPEAVISGYREGPADIWAVGCAVVEMASGAPPWGGDDDLAALLMRIGVGDEVPEIPASLSEEGRDFIGKCFVKDPIQRWTAEMLLDHRFVSDIDDDRDSTDQFNEKEEKGVTISPKCPFDFPDWVCSITPLPSPEYSSPGKESDWLDEVAAAERLRRLSSDGTSPDWSNEDWVTVRCPVEI